MKVTMLFIPPWDDYPLKPTLRHLFFIVMGEYLPNDHKEVN